MRKTSIGALWALILCTMASASAFAQTETVTFTYSGTGSGLSDAGSGSFSYNGSLSLVGLGNLTDFTYSDTDEVDLSQAVFNFGLADLTKFSATIDPVAGDVTALSLTTETVSSPSGSYPSSGYFGVVALSFAYFNSPDAGTGTDGLVTTSGPVLSTVPEGGTGWMYLLLAGGGLACVFASRIVAARKAA